MLQLAGLYGGLYYGTDCRQKQLPWFQQFVSSVLNISFACLLKVPVCFGFEFLTIQRKCLSVYFIREMKPSYLAKVRIFCCQTNCLITVHLIYPVVDIWAKRPSTVRHRQLSINRYHRLTHPSPFLIAPILTLEVIHLTAIQAVHQISLNWPSFEAIQSTGCLPLTNVWTQANAQSSNYPKLFDRYPTTSPGSHPGLRL